jgi:predicted TIM-barrel fold metal-dependent hydrolase
MFLHSVLAGSGLVAAQTLRASADHAPSGAQTQTQTPATPPGAVSTAARGPIIDVHMHAYPADMTLPTPLDNPATGKPNSVTTGETHLRACLAEMKRLNIVTGIVSGGDGDRLGAAMHWHEAAPDRIIAAAGVRGSEDTPLPEIGVLRRAFTDRRLRVLGEVTSQYAGRSLSDELYEPYLALAEELDIPVSLHSGMAPPGTSFDPCCRGLRARLGNPLLVEEALNRHPKLRLNLMHAGWPYLQDTVAILTIYPQVNADLGALNWLAPREEFYAYLGGLMRAGFGKRVMFGSDQMYWPEGIGLAVDAVDAAPFLTAAQKRDIFYNNAVRFFKLESAGEGKTG